MSRIIANIASRIISTVKHPLVLHLGVFFLLYFPLLAYGFLIMVNWWLVETAQPVVVDATSIRLFLNSVQVGVWTACCAMLFGLVVYSAYRCVSSKFQFLILIFSFAPLAFPPFAVATAWMTLGSIKLVFAGERVLLGGGENLSWLYTMPGVGLVLGCCYWPIVFLVLLLYARPSDQECDASLIYLSPWRRIHAVYWHGIRLPLLLGGVLAFGLGFSQFEVPSLLQVNVFALEIYVRFSALLDELSGLVLCLMFLPLSLMLAIVLGPMQQQLGAVWYQSQPKKRSLFQYIVIGCSLILLFVSIVLPVVALSFHAVSGDFSSNVSGLWRTTRHSMLNAFSASVLLMMLGLIMCARASPRALKFSLMGMFFLFFVPGIFVGSAILNVRSFLPGRLPFFVQWLSLQWGLVIHYAVLSLVMGAILWSLIDRSAREAAWMHFASSVKRIRYVYLTTLLPSMVVAVVFTMLFMWHDIAMTVLLHAPGGETLALRYFNLLHYGSEPRTATVGLALVVLPLLMYLGFSVLLIITKRYKGI